MRHQNLATAFARAQAPIRVIYIASYPPRRCGISTFTSDLTTALDNLNPDALAEIVALDDNGETYDYPWEVKLHVGQHKRADYLMAARYINQSSADIVCLQHEFGLFGGPEGDYSTCLSANSTILRDSRSAHIASRHYILDLLERIEKPIVTTFHTILPDPDASQLYIMSRIIDRSAAVIAMTEDSRQILQRTYDCPPEKAVVIYHGVPDFTFNDIARNKRRLHIKAEPMLLAAGLLGSGKGLEYIIEAMACITQKLPKAKLYIVGQTHPVILRNEGESYRNSLAALAKTLRVSRSVHFVNTYLSNDALHRYYQAADFFITAHRNLDQSASGTLAWALGAGKVCISTPFNYAREVLADNTGILVKKDNGSAIASQIVNIYTDREWMHELRKRAYAKGRKFTWPNVGLSYLNLFRLVLKRTNSGKTGSPKRRYEVIGSV